MRVTRVSTTATASREARSAPSSCSAPPCARRRDARPPRAQLDRRCRARARRARAAARRRRRGRRRRPPCASSTPTSCTCTTCCRRSARAALAAARAAGARGGAPPPQPPALLRDRRGRARRRPLLPLPPPQHAAGPGAQLPRLAAGGASSTRPAWPATSRAVLDARRPLRRAERVRARPVGAARAARATGSRCSRITCRRTPSPSAAGPAKAATRSWRPARAREGHRHGDQGGRARRHPAAGRGRRARRRPSSPSWPNLIGGQVDFIGRQDRAGMERELARRRDGPDAVALPRVLALLGARGDGRRRAGGRLASSAACRS